MPELGSYGSVRGARGNSRPYRESRRDPAKPTRMMLWTAPLKVVCFNATTLWHFDAAEWAPPTASIASVWRCPSHFRFTPHSRRSLRGSAGPKGADFVAKLS
jgi:hypothetical protein